ncbi:hypothetical protein BCR32DRAFT_279100 [Anaeromyces robustus]|uniref:Uncharacterized protein n=1 Tax=Anaeromyces robustus TaxID=1754192 RepID=A0A1Y1X9X7_9FUNG|nr:hypothetical protein BCR32DRAFT_279100 [Anaeromyces robustus]|eukprot:ORX82226.1 hypothetical protein BCR32DRAFT_279100 [Anaeromyces robustus]
MSSTTLVFSLGVSFILGYLFSYLNFFQALASIFTDYSSIQNKSKEYPFQTSAREQLARRGSF